MFVVGPNPFERLSWGRRCLVDEDREAVFLRIAGNGPVPGEVFLLVIKSQQIPVEVLATSGLDAGRRFTLNTITSLGSSTLAHLRYGIESHHFDSDSEREYAEKLTIEGLLVFGDAYDGLSKPDGYQRARTSASDSAPVFRLSSFGYPSEVSD
ncbi:MAG: hypothetical protein JWQ12_844 [Glaciihabitans sp.]|jgi:hypothetical protein|nr:hypothetical protein [Glaciihabitans sp.]